MTRRPLRLRKLAEARISCNATGINGTSQLKTAVPKSENGGIPGFEVVAGVFAIAAVLWSRRRRLWSRAPPQRI